MSQGIKLGQRQVALWHAAILVFVAMCAEDVAGTVMVVKEAHYTALSAGLFDVMGWIFGLICSSLAIASIIQEGWRTKRSIVLIVSVSLANFGGTFVGVAIAHGLAH